MTEKEILNRLIYKTNLMLQRIVILPICCKYMGCGPTLVKFCKLGCGCLGRAKTKKKKALVFLVSVFHMDAPSYLFKTL